MILFDWMSNEHLTKVLVAVRFKGLGVMTLREFLRRGRSIVFIFNVLM